MKILFFIVPLCVFVYSCTDPVSPVNIQSGVDYYQNSDNQQVFSFGNKNANRNVLVVLGSDIYRDRFLNIGNDYISSRILSYIVNPKLEYYYPDDPYSKNYDQKFVYKEYVDWKSESLDLNNAFYYVIVTSGELDKNLFSLIKSSGLVFSNWMWYRHSNRDYTDARMVNSRSISRVDLLTNLDDPDIKKCFSKDCLGLMISCSLYEYSVSDYSLASLLSYYTGVKNMIASRSVVFDNGSVHNRKYSGDFRTVSYDENELRQAYDQYKNLVSVVPVNSLKGSHLAVDLPVSSVLNNDAKSIIDSNGLYRLVYSSSDVYYHGDNQVSACEMYFNYQDRMAIWKVSYLANNGASESSYYQVSSDYFGLFLLIFDIYGNGSSFPMYIDLAFSNP